MMDSLLNEQTNLYINYGLANKWLSKLELSFDKLYNIRHVDF